MFKTIYILCFFFLQIGISFSQVGFMKVDSFEVISSSGNCVVQYDEDLYIGVGRLYNQDWIDLNIFFAQYNSEGELIVADTFKDDFFLHNDFHNDLFVANGKVYALPSSEGLDYLVEYDPLSREMSIVHTFEGNYPGSAGFIPISDKEFIILIIDGGNPQTTRVMHIKDSSLFNEFIIPYLQNEVNIGMRELVLTKDSTLMIAGYNHTNNGAFFIPAIFEYSIYGELLWEFRFPDEYENCPTRDFLIDDNDDIVLSYFHQPNQFDGTEPHIVKVNKEEGILWDIPFGQRIGNYPWHMFNRILMSHDRDGYVLGGTLVKDGDNFRSAAIGKVSLDGDSLWLRTYPYTTDPGDNTFLNDLEYTNDGGYIGIGGHVYAALSTVPEGATSRKTILLKINEDGLLSNSDISPDSDTIHNDISIFPNPANSEIVIHLDYPEALKYSIYDMYGKRISTLKNKFNTTSISADVSGYPKGIYFLKALNRKGESTIETFVVH